MSRGYPACDRPLAGELMDIEAIRKTIVDRYGDGFYRELLNNEAVPLDGAFAILVHRDTPGFDESGNGSMVFRVVGFDGSMINLRWDAYFDSYGGCRLYYESGQPHEVREVPVTATRWEAK